MNKDDLFLENLYTLLDAGYNIEETLNICQKIFSYTYIDEMMQQLKQGISLEECLLKYHFSTTFKEYFMFFKNKNCLSEAIEKSLKICISQNQYKSKIKSQLTYPIILLTFLLVFSLFVMFVLLPKVNDLFLSFDIKKTLFFQIIYVLFYIIPAVFLSLMIMIIYIFLQLLNALKTKKFRIIERYLKVPFLRIVLQKYFSLKFAIYYQELLIEDMDSVSIIKLLNEQLIHSDLKIVLYEIANRLYEGETLENILEDFDYLDPLFITFFQMYVKNPRMKQSLSHYIQLTYQQIDIYVAKFLKYLIPCIYGFVGLFVITIYISIIIPMMNVISDI